MHSTNSLQSLWVGKWSYRSFNNIADLNTDPDTLLFGEGTIRIDPTDHPNQLKGLIYGPGWQLTLSGSITYGDPSTARFQGKGVVDGSLWIYEYLGYLVNPWQNGVDQVPAFVGSVCRQIPHPGGGGVHPAGVVVSFFSIRQPD
jgi:hypothetical protein